MEPKLVFEIELNTSINDFVHWVKFHAPARFNIQEHLDLLDLDNTIEGMLTEHIRPKTTMSYEKINDTSGLISIKREYPKSLKALLGVTAHPLQYIDSSVTFTITREIRILAPRLTKVTVRLLHDSLRDETRRFCDKITLEWRGSRIRVGEWFLSDKTRAELGRKQRSPVVEESNSTQDMKYQLPSKPDKNADVDDWIQYMLEISLFGVLLSVKEVASHIGVTPDALSKAKGRYMAKLRKRHQLENHKL